MTHDVSFRVEIWKLIEQYDKVDVFRAVQAQAQAQAEVVRTLVLRRQKLDLASRFVYEEVVKPVAGEPVLLERNLLRSLSGSDEPDGTHAMQYDELLMQIRRFQIPKVTDAEELALANALKHVGGQDAERPNETATFLRRLSEFLFEKVHESIAVEQTASDKPRGGKCSLQGLLIGDTTCVVASTGTPIPRLAAGHRKILQITESWNTDKMRNILNTFSGDAFDIPALKTYVESLRTLHDRTETSLAVLSKLAIANLQ